MSTAKTTKPAREHFEALIERLVNSAMTMLRLETDKGSEADLFLRKRLRERFTEHLTSVDSPAVINAMQREAGSVMLSAFNLCPHDVLGQPARMRWIAAYFLKHYRGDVLPGAASPAQHTIASLDGCGTHEALACGHCAGVPALNRTEPYFYVDCLACGAQGPRHQNEFTAVEHWNRRAL